ncbi:MAG: hypothetical protein JWN15_2831, partial [Firmicutes bacterium]|nr:hypothetical protein [Bacillota bacterium]
TTTDPVDPAMPCILSWNNHNTQQMGYAGEFATGYANNAPSPGYASVGYSADFPDRCMITVGNPLDGEAEQFVQDASHHWSQSFTWRGSMIGLPSNVLSWNATILANGVIDIGAPQ